MDVLFRVYNWLVGDSSFTHKYLKDMNTQQLIQFDNLLNNPDNDWQLYYWIIGNILHFSLSTDNLNK